MNHGNERKRKHPSTIGELSLFSSILQAKPISLMYSLLK